MNQKPTAPEEMSEKEIRRRLAACYRLILDAAKSDDEPPEEQDRIAEGTAVADAVEETVAAFSLGSEALKAIGQAMEDDMARAEAGAPAGPSHAKDQDSQESGKPGEEENETSDAE